MFSELKRRLHNYFRIRRLSHFVDIYPDLANLSVLDVGGTETIWKLLKEHFNLVPKRLVLLNSNPGHLETDCGYETVTGDARHIPFLDKSFDLVFSNSVIEHVGDAVDKANYAAECQRVGKQIYIQTPNRWFPIEPHIIALYIHWLPRPLYKKVHFLSIMHVYQRYRILTQGNPGNIDTSYWVENADLLSYDQVKFFFPDRQIYSERILGYCKSFIIR